MKKHDKVTQEMLDKLDGDVLSLEKFDKAMEAIKAERDKFEKEYLEELKHEIDRYRCRL